MALLSFYGGNNYIMSNSFEFRGRARCNLGIPNVET